MRGMEEKNPRRKRATGNPDHARRRNKPACSDADIEKRLEELVKPAVYAEVDLYRQLGLRNRILNLPVMVSVVLAMIWRQVSGVCDLQRMLARERMLWAAPTRVSQAALSERFLTFPAVLFERVLYEVIRQLPARSQARTRPQPVLLERLKSRFPVCLAVDGTTLEALFRKLKSLQGAPDAGLAGHVVASVDLFTHLPAKLWWFDDPASNDKLAIPGLLAWLRPGSLLVFDLGYFSFPFFDALTESQCVFVTRLRNKTSYQVQKVLVDQPRWRECIVRLGQYRSNPSRHPVRLIEIDLGGQWYRYITNALAPSQLDVAELVGVYECRWHIETTFLLVKRLLGLSYLWVGSLNGVQLQVWATFLFYAILIDLCDDVANQLQLPLQAISVEMVFRSLYYYTVARAQGSGETAAEYLARDARGLGIIKRQRARAGPTLSEQVNSAVMCAAPVSDH